MREYKVVLNEDQVRLIAKMCKYGLFSLSPDEKPVAKSVAKSIMTAVKSTTH